MVPSREPTETLPPPVFSRVQTKDQVLYPQKDTIAVPIQNDGETLLFRYIQEERVIHTQEFLT